MAAVAVDGVWKYFGDFPAIREVSLTADSGECLALLGRNGAGKTTLLRILAGLSAASRGGIRLFGQDARSVQARLRTGYLGHGIGVYEELSARENLELFAKLYQLQNPGKLAGEWLERTGLDRAAGSLVREFSRGMRQRLAVARAFLHEPGILLLDEPFTALDDRAIQLLEGLLQAARERGAAVVMSTHQLREALELATRVSLLVRGRVAYSGPRTAEMLADPGWLYRHYGEAT